MKRKSGFTLMEMLIVVAIIAILIIIAIPVFHDVPEKAREATDEANLRSCYANLLRDGMMGLDAPQTIESYVEYSYDKDKTYTAIINAQQRDASGWLINDGAPTIDIGTLSNVPAVATPGTWTMVYNAVTGETTITNG